MRSLAPIERILLGTDGTVTFVLEAFTGEAIEAVKLSQQPDRAHPLEGAALDLRPGAAVVRRWVLLRGVESRRNLLFAHAVLAAHRVDPHVLEALRSTEAPIGRLLAENRIETFREILRVGSEPAASAASHFDVEPNEALIFRTYRILTGGLPIMLITERLSPNLALAGAVRANLLGPGFLE